MKFQRIYHPWHEWEEIKFNMWGDVNDREKAIIETIKFTGDHKLYGSYMKRVIREWPVSCENALTDYLINRKAWLGHAACALALKIPEDIVRLAWGKLSNEQQFLANQEAEQAIREWENRHAENSPIQGNMAQAVLL